MSRSPKMHIQAWALFFVVFTLTIILIILSIPLRDSIRKSDFLWFIYSLIPVLTGIISALVMNRKLLKSFSFRAEITYWYRYLYFILLITGLVFFSLSIISKVKQPPILVQLTEITDLTRDFSDLFYLNSLLFFPLFEEMFFRGIILEGFLSKYSVKKAVLLSSIFFGLIHLYLFQKLHAFLLGIITGWYYSRTRNLLSCMIIHFLNNLVYLIMLKPAVDKFRSLPAPGHKSIFYFEHFWLTLFCSLLAIIISLVALKRTMKTEPAGNQIAQG